MAPATGALWFLLVIVYPSNGSGSAATQIGPFQSKLACQNAMTTIEVDTDIEAFCVPDRR